jgi:hypothetical protein
MDIKIELGEWDWLQLTENQIEKLDSADPEMQFPFSLRTGILSTNELLVRNCFSQVTDTSFAPGTLYTTLIS